MARPLSETLAGNHRQLLQEWQKTLRGQMEVPAFLNHVAQQNAPTQTLLFQQVADYLVAHQMANSFQVPYPTGMPEAGHYSTDLQPEAVFDHSKRRLANYEAFQQMGRSLPEGQESAQLVKGWLWEGVMTGGISTTVEKAVLAARADYLQRQPQPGDLNAHHAETHSLQRVRGTAQGIMMA